MVGGVELGADAERRGHDFAAFAEDVEEEFGAVGGAAAVGVGARVAFGVEELIFRACGVSAPIIFFCHKSGKRG